MNKKGFIQLLAVVVVVVAVLGVFGYMRRIQDTPPASSKEEMKTVTLGSHTFSYPALLTAIRDGATVRLRHSVPVRHQDPCDFRGDNVPLEELVDFDTTITLYPSWTLAEVVRKEEGEYMAKELLIKDAFKTATGFVEPVIIGAHSGHRVSMGVEGCGRYTYYFMLPNSGVLFVKRPYITALSPSSGETERARLLALPEVISPEEEASLFTDIVSSFR